MMVGASSGLDALLRPRSVAIIGASRDPGKLGYLILDNLLRYGFRGRVYPVNPHAATVLGLPAYPDIRAVPESVDLALVVVPAGAVAGVLESCGLKGVRSAVIITAGFAETGPEGAAAQQRLADIGRAHGIRLVGPNSVGILNPYYRLNGSFAEGLPREGGVAVLTQSGAVAAAILDWAGLAELGFSQFVSLGNTVDVNAADLLHTWARDPTCRVVVGYLESVGDGKSFMAAARFATAYKPVVMMKVGQTDAGAVAARSHTGALAGADRVVDAAFRQVGIVRAYTMDELFDLAMAFAYAPLPSGRRVAVVTNAGGPGVMATDALERHGLLLSSLASDTERRLVQALPALASARNPVDLRGDADASCYLQALQQVQSDPGVDGVLALLTPQVVTEPEATARVIAHLTRTTEKPILAVYMGGVAVSRGRDMLEHAGVPVYAYPERAARAMGALASYAEYRRSLQDP